MWLCFANDYGNVSSLTLQILQNDTDVSIYGCGIYTQPNEVQQSNLQCRALYDREPGDRDEMRFTKGDIIVNVNKRNPDWLVFTSRSTNNFAPGGLSDGGGQESGGLRLLITLSNGILYGDIW